MTLNDSYKHFKAAQAEAISWLQKETSSLRTGRVKTNLIEALPVEHYGARTPLQGLASISSSDPRTLVISPWDPTALPAIEKAITAAQLGTQPTVDGQIIRLSFPSLTEELRATTIKMLNKKAEEARVRLRQGRDEALSLLKKAKEDSDITEDDFYEGKEQLNKLIDEANAEIAQLVSNKEVEVTTI